jgi:hypothetical protein
MEHKRIYSILFEQQISAYFKYVDDILTIYDQNKTNVEYTISEFNKLQPFIKLTMGK